MKDLLAKAGKPLAPGEGFQGVVGLDGTFTPYPTIDAYLAESQIKRGIYGTIDQERNNKRLEAIRKAA